MPEVQTLTDATLADVLNGDKPVVLALYNGEGLRGDFSTAMKKAAEANGSMIFAQVDTSRNPETAARFNVGRNPIMIAWYCGETLVRRNRPWGPDVQSSVDTLKTAASELPGATPEDEVTELETTESKEQAIMAEDKPVAVTDATFQQEVIDYDLPVVVDFWAEWCGPCRMVAPILDKLAGEYAGKIRIAKVDVDQNPMLSQTFRVQSIPTIMMFKQRNIVFSQPGALPEPALRDLFDQLVSLEIPAQAEGETEEAEEPAN
jgi:thioredoxin